MKLIKFFTLVICCLLTSCGGGGGSKGHDPVNLPSSGSPSSSTAISQSSTTSSNLGTKSDSASANTCRDIKPVCTVSVSPETTASRRYPQSTSFYFVARCNAFIQEAEWINLASFGPYTWSTSRFGFDLFDLMVQPEKGNGYRLLSPIDPNFDYSHDRDVIDVSESSTNHPFRFNYANCAGGGQIDFCFYTNGYPNAKAYLNSPLCSLTDSKDTVPLTLGTAFASTGTYLVGSRTVKPDVLFPNTFIPGKTQGTWTFTGGSNTSSSTVTSSSNSAGGTITPGSDANCDKGNAVLQTPVCTSIPNQTGICNTDRQTIKCFTAVLNESNGCLASDIDAIKKIIKDAEQQAKDVCI